jgi:polyhydroxyalkanoate synthesis regulator phasin
MPPSPDWKRALETGIQFTELRRSQAHRLATDLVAQGQLARDQIGAAVDELVEMSRHRSEELRKVVSSEVQRQLGVLGLATKNDLAAMERRLRASKPAESATKKAPKTAPAKKAPAKKAPAKKAPAKKAAKKTPARKGAAKSARKAPAKQAR